MPRCGPFTFYLDTDQEKDKVIKAYLDGVRERRQNMSQAIRDLCFKGLTGKGGTLEDIQERLDRIEQALSGGLIIGSRDDSETGSELAEAEAALDAMKY